MADAMVTGRMPERKKREGLRALKRSGLNASQAINIMFDRAIKDGNGDFLETPASPNSRDWAAAEQFIDSLSHKKTTRFDNMTRSEIKHDRLSSRGLI